MSKEGCWIVVGQVLAMAGSLLGVRMLTGLMSPAAYGELALGITVAILVNQTVTGPLVNGITRFYAPAVEQNDLRGYFSAVRRWVLLGTQIIVVMTFFAIVILLAAGRTAWIPIVIAALIFATISGYNSILSGIQNAARQRSVVALHQGLEPWARFLAAAALILRMGASSVIAMSGYVIAIIFVLGSQYAFFRKIIPYNVSKPETDKTWWKDIWTYSWPFASWGLFTWAQVASDRWALQLVTTTQEVGLYTVLLQLGYYPMSMATGMAIQLLTPIFYQRAGDATDILRIVGVGNLSWRLTEFALAATGVCFLLALCFHGQLFHILVGKQYASISYLLPWTLLAGGIFAAGQSTTLNLMSQNKTQAMALAKIVTAVSGVIFNFAGAYLLRIKGVVFAGVLFSVFYFVWITMLSRQANKASRLQIERAS
jgi:O-antigen/teichoic acid export membrane protein